MKAKRKIICLISAGMMSLNACDSCSDSDSLAEKGSRAAVEFCDCFKTKSDKKCLEELRNQYSNSVYTSDEFIKAFNQTNKCGVQLVKEYITSKASETEVFIEPNN